MKIALPTIFAFVLCGCTLSVCSCTNIETRRIARLNQNQGSVEFQVSGFYNIPLTAEGPFPKWSNDLKVILRPGKEIPKVGKQTFTAWSDFSTLYDAVESGTVVIDRDKQQIDVNVKYTKLYSFNRANGRFSIETVSD